MFVYMTCISNDGGEEGEDLLELVLPTSLSQQVAGVGECRPCRRVDSALDPSSRAKKKPFSMLAQDFVEKINVLKIFSFGT